MATRRPQPISSLPDDSTQDPASIAEKSNTSPAVPPATIIKLALFTILMFTGPLAAYYISIRTLFSGNATYAAALAAFVANLVVVAYVVVAILEDQGDLAEEKERRRGGAEREKGGKRE